MLLKVQKDGDRAVTVGLSIMEIHSDLDGAVFSDMVGTETLFKWVEE